jgi:hypothetical protein
VLSVGSVVNRKKLSLQLNGKNDLLLERWAVKNKAKWFEKVFDLNVAISEGPTL